MKYSWSMAGLWEMFFQCSLTPYWSLGLPDGPIVIALVHSMLCTSVGLLVFKYLREGSSFFSETLHEVCQYYSQKEIVLDFKT